MGRIPLEDLDKVIRSTDLENIAKEYPKLIKEAYENRWAELSKPFEGTDADPADVMAEEADMLVLFKYRMSLMVICCLAQFFEQDLCNYLLGKGVPLEKGCLYGDMEDALKEKLGVDVSEFPKIAEMRMLVNAIKHGDGRSFQEINEKLGQSILADSSLTYYNNRGEVEWKKQRDLDRQALTSRTLEVKGKIDEYYSEILELWEAIYKAEDKRQSE